MSPEDDWRDVEWFDSHLWRPQTGRNVMALTVDSERIHAVYDGNKFLSSNDLVEIIRVAYWCYDDV
jgi:hypothetical protein